MRESIKGSSDDPGTGPIRPQFVVAQVREALADDAVVALEDPRALTIPDLTSEGEDRFVSIGLDAEARVLLTVYTHRSDRIRIILCRGATPAERRFYEEY